MTALPIPSRYIESFDSIRFAHTEDIPGRRESRRLQAELELMLSMLFGEPMHLPEAQSFDSAHFLRIAHKVLDARPTDSNNSPVWDPFLLAIRPNTDFDDYRGLVAVRFAQQEPPYILSGWPEISSVREKRMDLARRVNNGEFREARKSYRELTDRLAHLQSVDEYFRTVPIGAARTISLRERIHAAAGPGVDRLPRDRAYLVDIPSILQELEQKHNVNLNNRSDIRDKGPGLLKRGVLERNQYEFLVEYIDSTYNRVMAEAIGASAGVFSTEGSASDVDVILGEAASEEGTRNLRRAEGRPTRLTFDLVPGASSTGSLEELLEARDFWGTIWEIVTSSAWIASVNALHNALERNWGPREALQAHVELLASQLKDFVLTLEQDGVRIRRNALYGLAGGGATMALMAVLDYWFGVDPDFYLSSAPVIAMGYVAAVGPETMRERRARGKVSSALMDVVQITEGSDD